MGEVMQAGRALDALIAEKVMGWIEIEGESGIDPEFDPDGILKVPRYSTDIAAAFEVLEKLNKLGFGHTIAKQYDITNSRWVHSVSVNKVFERGVQAVTDSVPLAVCLCALKALGTNPAP